MELMLPTSGDNVAGRISERQLSEIWRHQWLGGALTTEDGEPLKVLYAGRVNDDRGGDFRDAVIALGDRTVTGDVELHVNSRDWVGHGHHQDARYNRVVLHVVFRNNASAFTRLQDGREIPVLALGNVAAPHLLEEPSTFGRRQGRPCPGVVTRRGESEVAGWIEEAGDARFAEKAKRFRDQLAMAEPGQTMYQGIMEAMGYSRNKEPFLELAQRLPLAALEELAARRSTDTECYARIHTVLIETAGFLVPEPSNAEGEVERPGNRPVRSSPLDWDVFRARPNNSPLIRMAAMAELVVRYRRRGLLRSLLGGLSDSPLDGGCKRLENALSVPRGEYTCSDGSPQAANCCPLGISRARDIVVNVLLPFAHAFGEAKGDPDLSQKSVALYHRHGRLAGNCVERHMACQLGLSGGFVNSARRQQGLLHIYSRFCIRGRCGTCPLGQFQVRHHIEAEAIDRVAP